MRGSITLGMGLAMAAASGAAFWIQQREAAACGCFAPPAITEGDYAVNQQAEQIIFEVEEGYITAHVLIQFSGAPEEFAWIVPVPSAPELSLSSSAAFALLDRATAPIVNIQDEDLCPESEWLCNYHDPLYCGDDDDDDISGGDDDDDAAADAGASGGVPPVEVIDRQTIGSYDTVVFAADDAAAAVQWLNDEGFIVNNTMSPYMQPYLDQEMLFVASKLIPGADTAEIKPLRMRFADDEPMIPLILTSIAAEPHLTVTAFIYSDELYQPRRLETVTIDERRISADAAGRSNYPMVLARTIDEAGGRAFITEYASWSALPIIDDPSDCCGSDYDFCNVAYDGVCSCPGSEFDADDCAEETDLLEGVALLQTLQATHPVLTRITTRLSPEEMRFDPWFEAAPDATSHTRLTFTGHRATLDACVSAIIDDDLYQELRARQGCASTYCGLDAGTCVATVRGAGCDCADEFVARAFVDLDGLPSVTCVPEVPTVDLAAGGLELPDICAGLDCGVGTCLDLNGVAHCVCDDGAAAAIDPARKLPICSPITGTDTGVPGGDDFSEALADVSVCRPEPPYCAEGGWYTRRFGELPEGEDCGNTSPDPSRLSETPEPTCGGGGWFGHGSSCGCASGGASGGALTGGATLAAATALLLRRRRRRA